MHVDLLDSNGTAPWSARARELVEGRSFVLVGIGVDQMRDFERFGGFVRGAVSVVPAGGPSSEAFEAYPVISLTGRTRNIFDFVVDDYATTLMDHVVEVSSFLDQVDPSRKATVVSYLPAPRAMAGERTAWFPDVSLTRELEDKAKTSQLLEPELPSMPSEPVPTPLGRDAWDSACRRWGSSRLVLQRLGLNGGGRGTWICNQFDSAVRLVSDEGPLKWSPFLEGEDCNVMGVVLGANRTAAFPPSRQLIDTGPNGQPVYAGNVFDDAWTDTELDGIAVEVKAFGRSLSARGFEGPFGLDFIRRVDGQRTYHDINPRMNGAIDSLAFCLTEDTLQPLRVLVLGRRVWLSDEVRSLECQLRYATRAYPVTRFFLSREIQERLCVDRPPAAGLWRVDVKYPRLEYVGASVEGSQTPVGDLALLRPVIAPGTSCEEGDRLVLGDLFCTGTLARELRSLHRRDTQGKLFDALLA